MDERGKVLHLLRRAGFGPGADAEEWVALGVAGAIDRLLDPGPAPPDDTDAGLTARGFDLTTLAGIQAAWLFRMATGGRPLVEKLALFWHGLFATANQKVNSPELMWQQYELFRQRGLGPFAELALAVSRDPAMLVWLDGNQNRKAAPNENYGRELLELFTLGIGNYTENDVKACARAFTGWSFAGTKDPLNKRYVAATFAFDPKQHDATAKTFLGQTGSWDGTDIVRIVLEQPACARFIARRLVAFFGWDAPTPEEVQPFADVFAHSGGDIRATLGALFRSPRFLSDRAFHAKIASPVEHVVRVTRLLGLSLPPKDAAASARRMGQALFDPPNVGGWTSGTGWISPGSVLERTNFANRVVTNRAAGGFDPGAFFAQLQPRDRSTGALLDALLAHVVDGDATTPQRQALLAYLGATPTTPVDTSTRFLDGKGRGLVHLVTSLPQFPLL